MIRPSNNPLSRGYSSTHKGYDFKGLNLPDEVIAGADGVIEQRVDLYVNSWTNTGTLTTRDYGNYIKIKHDDGSYELHAHLRKGSALNQGTRVIAGQTVARIGNTGNSTGPHLHSEYRNSKNVNIEVVFTEGPIMTTDIEKLQAELAAKEATLKDVTRQRDELDTNNKSLTLELKEAQTNTKGFRDQFNDLVAKLASKLSTRQEPVEILAAVDTCITYEDKATELDRILTLERQEHSKSMSALEKELSSVKAQLMTLEIKFNELKNSTVEPIKTLSILDILKSIFGR